ncbi:hypothetical protein [Streptomyces sp. NPDC058373]|uniref:hypothetical protein n=1 Tax=Streptomyces sp. NPDC058373 TaxID=3346465 RepID=UPI0036578646
MTVVANLCLGVIGIFPFFLLTLFLSNLGLTGGEPAADGALLRWALVVTPLTVGFCALWYAVNRGLRHLPAPAHTRRHWGLAVLLTSAPALSLPVGALVRGSF